MVHATAVTEGFKETAVARIAGVAAGQVVAQAGLLMRDTAAGGTGASSLKPYSFTQILWLWQRIKKYFNTENNVIVLKLFRPSTMLNYIRTSKSSPSPFEQCTAYIGMWAMLEVKTNQY